MITDVTDFETALLAGAVLLSIVLRATWAWARTKPCRRCTRKGIHVLAGEQISGTVILVAVYAVWGAGGLATLYCVTHLVVWLVLGAWLALSWKAWIFRI